LGAFSCFSALRLLPRLQLALGVFLGIYLFDPSRFTFAMGFQALSFLWGDEASLLPPFFCFEMLSRRPWLLFPPDPQPFAGQTGCHSSNFLRSGILPLFPLCFQIAASSPFGAFRSGLHPRAIHTPWQVLPLRRPQFFHLWLTFPSPETRSFLQCPPVVPLVFLHRFDACHRSLPLWCSDDFTFYPFRPFFSFVDYFLLVPPLSCT